MIQVGTTLSWITAHCAAPALRLRAIMFAAVTAVPPARRNASGPDARPSPGALHASGVRGAIGGELVGRVRRPTSSSLSLPAPLVQSTSMRATPAATRMTCAHGCVAPSSASDISESHRLRGWPSSPSAPPQLHRRRRRSGRGDKALAHPRPAARAPVEEQLVGLHERIRERHARAVRRRPRRDARARAPRVHSRGPPASARGAPLDGRDGGGGVCVERVRVEVCRGRRGRRCARAERRGASGCDVPRRWVVVGAGTGARERERCAREEERRAAASADGCGCSAASAGQSVAGGTISSSSAGRGRDAGARRGVLVVCGVRIVTRRAPPDAPCDVIDHCNRPALRGRLLQATLQDPLRAAADVRWSLIRACKRSS